jgi:hypothetical protein
MERFIPYLKDMTECFDDHFPCQKEACDHAFHVQSRMGVMLVEHGSSFQVNCNL